MTPHLNESVVKTYPKKLQKWHMEMFPFFFFLKKGNVVGPTFVSAFVRHENGEEFIRDGRGSEEVS